MACAGLEEPGHCHNKVAGVGTHYLAINDVKGEKKMRGQEERSGHTYYDHPAHLVVLLMACRWHLGLTLVQPKLSFDTDAMAILERLEAEQAMVGQHELAHLWLVLRDRQQQQEIQHAPLQCAVSPTSAWNNIFSCAASTDALDNKQNGGGGERMKWELTIGCGKGKYEYGLY
ncbi:hypothetical protein EI94DRAFT_1702598 [Lactarius quietus]|nr:hypothetical protein EI94DRAFT_1702598 [Lactarius quietus]